MKEMDNMLLIAPDNEKTVLESEDQISEAYELSLDNDELENYLTDSIYVFKNKLVQ